LYEESTKAHAAQLRALSALGRYQQAFQADPNVLSLYATHADELAGLDEVTGALLIEADPAIKTQLGLPESKGLIVVRLAPHGPAAQIGLQPNDILLELADAELAKPEDLKKKLESAGEGPVELKILRSGKPLGIRVKPLKKVVIAKVDEPKSEYYIGVPATPVEDTMRAHLDLPKGHGLIISGEIVEKSPAAKAGLKQNDILLSLNEKPLDTVETLVATIQATKGKTAKVVILRAGKKEEHEITPEERKSTAAQESWSPLYLAPGVQRNFKLAPDQLARTGQAQFLLANPQGQAFDLRSTLTGAGADAMQKRLDSLDAEIKDLKKLVADLKNAIEKQKDE
jgi:membrane-associated protease RseP (regulator of RpoE activity)